MVTPFLLISYTSMNEIMTGFQGWVNDMPLVSNQGHVRVRCSCLSRIPAMQADAV